MSGWANSEKMTWLPVNDTLRSELGISNLTGRQGKVFYRLIRAVARESQLGGGAVVGVLGLVYGGGGGVRWHGPPGKFQKLGSLE